MANRFNRKNNNMNNQRRFNNFDRGDNFDRPRFNGNPWQGGIMPNSGPPPVPNTAAIADLVNQLFRSRQNNVPSLLDLNMYNDFKGNHAYNDRFGNKIGRNMPMGGQMNRRVASGGRNDRMLNKIRRPLRPNINKTKPNQKTAQDKKEPSESKAETGTESESTNVEVKVEKTENEAEAADANQSTSNAEGEGEEKGDAKKNEVKTEYDGIASEFLECHICEKKMWDGRSFDNHIKGRVHNIMMDKTKQSYHMTADAMRQELKINEMKKSKRGFVAGAKRVFCAMCDLYVFYAAAHRRSPGHQKLKKYLHPSCNTCHKEFPTRIELDEHRLTAAHLRLLQEKQKDVQSRPKPEVITISTLQDELAHVRPMHDAKKRMQAKKGEEGENKEENAENGVKTEVKEEPEQQQEEEAYLILDYKEGDDLAEMKRENLPKYQVDRPVGPSFISDFSCKQCNLCKKFFDTDETAEVHLRTLKHFQLYIKMLHSKGNFKIVPEANAGKREHGDDGGEEESDEKRRKTDNEGGDNVDEDDLLNGINVGENGDNAQEGQADTSMPIETPEISTEVEESVEQSAPPPEEVEPVEKRSPARGRGRGRGRGRRGRY